jgi:hypothetical protein
VASSSPTRWGDQNQCLPTAACSPSGPPRGLVTAAASGSFQLGTIRSARVSVTGPGSGSRVVSSGTRRIVSVIGVRGGEAGDHAGFA